MRYDKEDGLVHFDDYELGIIRERRSPIDYRAMYALAPKIGNLAAACRLELLELYNYDDSSEARSNRNGRIERLRLRSARLDGLVLEVQKIADDVEAERIMTSD